MQVLGLASVAAVLVVAGVSAASTLRTGRTSETTSEGTVVTEPKASGAAKARPKTVAASPAAPPVVQQQAAETPAVTAPAAAPVSPPAIAAPHAGYVLVEGRSRLTDSIYAERTGDSVVVNFDAYGYRTRRPDKLEQSLRLTLPMIFGRMATASLDTIAVGGFVTSHDVVGELAGNGMRVKLDNGATARIRVLTRIVTDGPIAIGYLAIIEK